MCIRDSRLNARMLHFAQNLMHYTMFEVVEARHADLLADVDKARTVDDALKCHDVFLDFVLKECLLANHKLLGLLADLDRAARAFANAADRFRDAALFPAATAPPRGVRAGHLHKLASAPAYVDAVAAMDADWTKLMADFLFALRNECHIQRNSHLADLYNRLYSQERQGGDNGGARDCSYDWGDTAECGGLDMRAYWLSVFGLAIAWVWVVIPTYVFAYEAHDELGEHTTGDTFKAAACSELGLLVVFLIIVIPMYFIINEVKLPVRDSVAKTSLRISRDVARRAAVELLWLRRRLGGDGARASFGGRGASARFALPKNLARREVVRRAARQKNLRHKHVRRRVGRRVRGHDARRGRRDVRRGAGPQQLRVHGRPGVDGPGLQLEVLGHDRLRRELPRLPRGVLQLGRLVPLRALGRHRPRLPAH